MAGEQLTPEFAESVDLPLWPPNRQKMVAELLLDPRMVGNRQFMGRGMPAPTISPEVCTSLSYTRPILGRRALERAAATIEYVNSLPNPEEGSEDGKDF
jgi:hypothetical protein